MRKGSFRLLGWSVASVAATGFVAAAALAEPPTNLITRPPRVEVQRPHAPHAVHKPPPELRTRLNDHPPHVIVNRAPQAVNLPITRVHKHVSVVPITHAPHVNKGRTVITVTQEEHTKTFKKH